MGQLDPLSTVRTEVLSRVHPGNIDDIYVEDDELFIECADLRAFDTVQDYIRNKTSYQLSWEMGRGFPIICRVTYPNV